MTTTPVKNAGRILSEWLVLTIKGTEGHDVKAACIACDSSDGMRVHSQTGVAHCYACKIGWSAFQLAEQRLGDRGAAVKLMIELGLLEDRVNGHSGNGRHVPGGVDLLEALAKEKCVSPEALKAYGATVNGGAVVMPMYGPDGASCSIFTMRPGGGKGKNAAGKPSGVFLPEGRRPQPGETWIVVEGCKDAAAARDLGFNALGLPGCELSEKFAPLLDDCLVTLVPDLDNPSQNGAQKSAGRLWGRAESIRVARLPGEIVSKKGADLRDVLKRSGGRELALKAIEDAKPWQLLSDDDLAQVTADSILIPEGRTDSANAKRLAAQYGEIIRYCDQWLKFVIFDGKRWAIDNTRRIEALAKSVGRRILEDVARFVPRMRDSKTVNEMYAFAKATNSANGIRNMIALVRSEPGIAILPELLDRDPWFLNVLNGTLDLKTQQLRPHRREDYITKLCPVEFRLGDDCPLWYRFMGDITDNNQRLIGFLRRMVGFSLTGTTREHVLLFLYGEGSNGKSTFLHVMLDLLGPDYAMQAPVDLLIAKNCQTHPTELADLHGKRFVACIENENGRRLAENLVKQLTGGDKVRARRMREDFWEFNATHKVWLAGNHKPEVRGTDHGIWRRIKLVPFTVTIPDERQDKNLLDKLRAELPGILNWALLGCAEWQAEGLGEPDEVRSATAQYREDMDIIGRFLRERCDLAKGLKTKASVLRTNIDAWCEENGEREISNRRLGEYSR